MIVNAHIQPKPIGFELVYHERTSAAKEFKAKRHPVLKKQDAKTIFHQVMKKNFLDQLNAYVKNCQTIIEESDYSQHQKRQSLSFAKEVQVFANGKNGVKSLSQICKFFLMQQKHFSAILPHPRNTNCATARANLDELMRTAKRVRQRKKIMQAA